MTNAYIFSHNRIATELSLSARARHYEHYPLVKGNVAPQVLLKSSNRLHKKSQQPAPAGYSLLSLDELLLSGKPVVLVFYSPVVHKADHLHFFKVLQDRLGQHATLIILADPGNSSIRQSADLLGKLNMYVDRHNIISEAFGLHNEQNPLWNWVPGVESDTAFINAFYVISPGKEIVFHHIDYGFTFFSQAQEQRESFIRDVLQKVQTGTSAPLAFATS
ncbi:hypothetical protein I5907_05170 [Panacibacter sp. DH6]|uniref:Alkyl hydroperoxide reductase subunit C/ Thiol specific antioxidant domain-containing protein n=1 Tax=Panacibacter microcysteis TaxID=2793269 RepID=A0A931GVY1_9BACT|nr:hypothetical protein [Panacibacter microcysteis]MBG9375613.1 hypothetical protein [Panacibacter microcysteis]